MENKRSEKLKHKPRGIIKWAPFNSLPEFTMQLKEKKKEQVGEETSEKNNTERDEWFWD